MFFDNFAVSFDDSILTRFSACFYQFPCYFQSGIVVLNRSSPSSNTIIMFSAAFANAVHPAAAAPS
jgi:hypothetical protein